MESLDKGHFGSNINSAHFVPCRGIVLFRRFYLYYFGTGINFGGLQVCLSKREIINTLSLRRSVLYQRLHCILIQVDRSNEPLRYRFSFTELREAISLASAANKNTDEKEQRDGGSLA